MKLPGSRHTSFYCASQMLHFLQIEDVWQLHVRQGRWHHLSNSIHSLLVSVSHFGHFPSVFFMIITSWRSVISELCCYIIIVLGGYELLPHKMVNLISKHHRCSDCPTNQPFSHLSLSPGLLSPQDTTVLIRPINNPPAASKC